MVSKKSLNLASLESVSDLSGSKMTFGKPGSAASSWKAVVSTLFSCQPTWVKIVVTTMNLSWVPQPKFHGNWGT